MKSEKIWKIQKKSKLNSEKICKIWKKSRLNSEKIWQLWKKSTLNNEKRGKYGRKISRTFVGKENFSSLLPDCSRFS